MGPSLVAGASLLVDYVLTVAVSVSAGVAAIASFVPFVRTHRVLVGLLLIALLAVVNLRGVKESGRAFAIPTYAYIVVIAGLLAAGAVNWFDGGIDPITLPEAEGGLAAAAGGVTLFLLARAFSSGAVALTGVEAISNGVPAFRRPESRNASTTLIVMGVILGAFFLGISLLAQAVHPVVSFDETVLSQLGRAVFGGGTALYVALQVSTAAILTLAANTAYADFPRLGALIARDGFLPRQLRSRGDRLVFSNGILLLSGAAAVLYAAFGGSTTALIPLYAVGVFLSFTLSQAGMVRHHLKLRERGWQRGTVVNAIGAARDRGGAGRRGGLEVHDRRLGAGGRDPADRAGLQGHPPPLRRGPRAAARRAGRARARRARAQPRDPRLRRAPRRAARVALRPLAQAQAPGRAVRGLRRRRAGADRGGVAPPQHPGAARRSSRAPSATSPAPCWRTWTTSTTSGTTSSSRSCCRSSSSTGRGRSCCTTRARWRSSSRC